MRTIGRALFREGADSSGQALRAAEKDGCSPSVLWSRWCGRHGGLGAGLHGGGGPHFEDLDAVLQKCNRVLTYDE